MDGENNGTPYFLMDDLGGKPPIFGNTHVNFRMVPFWSSEFSDSLLRPSIFDNPPWSLPATPGNSWPTNFLKLQKTSLKSMFGDFNHFLGNHPSSKDETSIFAIWKSIRLFNRCLVKQHETHISYVKIWFIIQLKQPFKTGCLEFRVPGSCNESPVMKYHAMEKVVYV